MIYNEGIAICRKVDIELEEEGDEGAWCWYRRGQSQHDVSAAIDEIEEKFWREIWSKSYYLSASIPNRPISVPTLRLGGENKDMIECPFSQMK